MLTRDDINNKIGMTALKDFKKSDNAKAFLIKMTSGTSTGTPLINVRRNDINSFFDLATIRELTGLSIHRPLFVTGSLNSRLTRLATSLAVNTPEAKFLLLDSTDFTEDIDRLLKDFSPDSLWGFPSGIAQVLPYIHDDSVKEKIKLIRTMGEFLTEQTEDLFKNTLPKARIMMSYGASEIGEIMIQSCGNLRRNVYHPWTGVEVDIVDAEDSGVGHIVISRSVWPRVHIKKYKIGDMGCLIKKQCVCGMNKTIEALGRKDFDYIPICGAIITRAEWERAMNELAEYVENYTMQVSEVFDKNRIRGHIHITIKPSKKLLTESDPKEYLSKNVASRMFVTASQTLSQLIEKGIFQPIEVSFVDSFPETFKDVKLQRII